MLQYTRSQLPTVAAVEPVHHGGPAAARGRAVRGVLAVQRPVLRAAVLEVARGGRDAEAVPRRASAPTCSGGCWECASAARSLSGLVFAFGTFFVVWLAWPLTSVYAFIPWALAAVELLVRRPGPLTGRRARRGDRPAVPGRPPRVELSPRVRDRRVLRRSGRCCDWRRARCGSAASLVDPAASRLRSRWSSARRWRRSCWRRSPSSCCTPATSPAARTRAAGYWPRKYLGALFLHDYWGRPTQLDLEAFMQVRGWYAGAATLMLAAAALIAETHRRADRGASCSRCSACAW